MISWNKSYRKAIQKEDRYLYLYLCWMFLNHHCFQGKIKNIPLLFIVSDVSYLGAYQAEVENKRVKRSCILFNSSIFNMSDSRFLEVLIHEMSHQYCFEVLIKPHRSHNTLWKKTYNDAISKSFDLINKKTGIFNKDGK